MINTLIFDIDGTILDTREFILQAFEHTLKTNGFHVPDRSIINPLIGSEFKWIYKQLSGVDEADSQHLLDEHRKFQLENLHLSKIYPNTLKTLEKLKRQNFKMSIVTSRAKETSLETLGRAGISSFFDTIIASEDSKKAKPDPEPLLIAIEKMKSEPEESVMIGDSHFDIEAGKNAGTKTVRCTYGFHTENMNNPEPDFIIDDVSELVEIFE